MHRKAVIRGYLPPVDEKTMRINLAMTVLNDYFGRVVRLRRTPPARRSWISGSWFLQSPFDLVHFFVAPMEPAYEGGGICDSPFVDDDAAITEIKCDLKALNVTSQHLRC
jgi:hypothetical protein